MTGAAAPRVPLTRGPGAAARRMALTRLRGTDDGQVLLLSIGYALLALLLVTVVVSATGVHLERKRLLAVADQAALAGAQAFDADAYYRRQGAAGEDAGGVGDGRPGHAGDAPGSADTPGLVLLSPPLVRSAVTDHLEASPGAARLEGLTLESATTPDGRTAVVTLRAVARPPLLSWVTAPWTDGIALHATSSARAG